MHIAFMLLIANALYYVSARTVKRSDVYIAGFFPYGVGVMNSDTGKSHQTNMQI